MSKSRVSLNIHAQAVPDVGKLKAFLLALNPVSVMMMDGLGLATEIATALPDCITIHRDYGNYGKDGDNDLVHRISPDTWYARQRQLGNLNIWRAVLNEPGFDDDTFKWLTWLIEKNITDVKAGLPPLKLVIANFSVGTPSPDDWSRFRKILEYCNLYRDWLILGCHEYWGGVVTSGLYGGYPDNANVAPGKPGGINLVQPDKWPDSTKGITQWHCGRFKFLVSYCNSIGLPPPRIIVTEHGADDTSDIKPWLDSLQKTAPYTSIRGWKTLANQWTAWFASRGWSAEGAYFAQLSYANRVYYMGTPVEAQLIYCWGHSSDEWAQFDVAEAYELQKLLVGDNAQPAPAPTNPPPNPALSIVFPPDFAARCELALVMPVDASGLNVREHPTTASALVGSIPQDGQYASVIFVPKPEETFNDAINGHTGKWLAVQFDNAGKMVQGFIFSGMALVKPALPADPPPEPLKTYSLKIGSWKLSKEDATALLQNVTVTLVEDT